MTPHTPTEEGRYRAQVLGVNGWVDGVLYTTRKDAEKDAEHLAEFYGREVRIVELHENLRIGR